MKSKCGVILLLILIVTSCYVAPRSIFIVQPAEETGIWLMGKQYFHAKTEDYKVALAFDQIDDYEYQFHAEVINHGDGPIIVAPENFYIVVHMHHITNTVYDSICAIDPEEQILETHKNKSREYATYETEVSNQTLFSFIDLISDIASLGDSQTDEEILQEENEDLQRENDELQTELEHEKSVKSLNSYLSKWESKALRKTTLPPGYLIRGNIYFPFIKKAHELEIHVNLLDNDIVFKYVQFEEKVK